MKNLESFRTVGRKIKLYSLYGKQYTNSLKKKKMELLYDSTIPLLGISKRIETVLKRYLYTLVHSSILKIAKGEEQPKCPLIDEWVKKMCRYTMEYYSALKRN